MLLLFAAGQQNRRSKQTWRHHCQRARQVAIGKLFGSQDAGHCGTLTETAIALGNRGLQKAQFPALFDQLAWQLTCFVSVVRLGAQIIYRVTVDRIQ